MAVSRRLAETTRVEAFSDGVFAIALTLLVLDLKAPAADAGGFGHALAHEWPTYLAFLAAFLNISAIWINHHDLFTRVERVDIRLICANLLLLLITTLFPWPATVISASRTAGHHDQVVAALLYAAIGFLVPIAWVGVYGYLSRHPELLAGPDDVAYTQAGLRRNRFSLVVFPLAAVLAFWEPLIAVAAYVVIPLFFIVTLLTADS